MPFKKLIKPLQESLTELGFEHATPFQQQIIPKIKGGLNLFGIAPEGSGKSTALALGVIQKLNGVAFDDVPRALIFVKDRDAAHALEEKFKMFLGNSDLRIYSAYEEPKINNQRDDIYAGVDIVIATPKRLSKLYYMNGINLARLQLLVVEDAEFIFDNSCHTDVKRITESVPKCQLLVFNKAFTNRMEKLQDLFMENAQIVEVE
ncbi:MAG: DEAD/DEAH box helicase [Bacteroidetes bacterium]|nr:DEAD/DEAH box helicase [Bacteroidota bacterium]